MDRNGGNIIMETMDNYKDELEASFKRAKEGDILRGTVVSVDEKGVTLDLNYFAPGFIPAENVSSDPNFSILEEIKVGDEVSAMVESPDDGNGNVLLSMKEANESLAWSKLKALQESDTVIHGKVGGVVNGGVIMYVEGIRGFIPASKLDVKYVEDTNEYLNKEIDVKIITLDESAKKLVLSAKEILQEKALEERKKKINRIEVGTVVEGVVEQLMDYGAFVDIGGGVTGLLHVSQISDKRIKHPKVVLSVGDKVKVKIIKVADGKISLSMKAANEVKAEEPEEIFDYKSEGEASTGLGSLLAKIKLD